MSPQTQQILNHLQRRGPITPLEALHRYGVFRLGARIWDLRQADIDIKTKLVCRKGKHFARYSLA